MCRTRRGRGRPQRSPKPWRPAAAAAWIRSLPTPPAPGPVCAWIAGDLSAAIRDATASLDPEDCDRVGPDGQLAAGGVGAVARSALDAVPSVVSTMDRLTPDQQVRLLAVAAAVTGTVRMLVDAPATAIKHGWPGSVPSSPTRPARTYFCDREP